MSGYLSAVAGKPLTTKVAELPLRASDGFNSRINQIHAGSWAAPTGAPTNGVTVRTVVGPTTQMGERSVLLLDHHDVPDSEVARPRIRTTGASGVPVASTSGSRAPGVGIEDVVTSIGTPTPVSPARTRWWRIHHFSPLTARRRFRTCRGAGSSEVRSAHRRDPESRPSSR